MNIQKHISRQFSGQVKRYGSDIDYYKYDPSNERNVYGEVLGIRYLGPTKLRCIFKKHPSREVLEEFGMSLDTEAIFRFISDDLAEENLEPYINDKIVLNGVSYFVHHVSDSEGAINNRSVFTAVGCKKDAFTNGK